MTTSNQKIFSQPEYWVLNYVTSNNERFSEHGFGTLNSALKRLRTIQLLAYPSTIQEVALSQVFELEEVDPDTQEEMDYLDECFMQAMEDGSK